MNNVLSPALFFALILTGCGAEEPVSSSEESTAADTATVVEEAPQVMEQPPAADPDAAPVLVEESAAEEEPADVEVPLLLAQADTSELRDSRFKEGQHYMRLVPTQPTVGGADKVEVAEVFWYGCNHCFDFEPIINSWAAEKPANSRFVRIPAMWNPLVELHGQLYYTEEVLANNGKLADREAFRAAVFNEYHRRNNRLTSESSIQALFERFGVNEEDFQKTWNSFEVAQKMRVAKDLGRRYGITGVPAIVVNGKYRTGAGEAGSYPRLLEVINELVARESAR